MHKTLALILLKTIFVLQTLFAQVPPSLVARFEAPGLRVPLDLAPGHNAVRVVDLIPGHTYDLVAVPRSPEQNTALRLQATDPGVESEAQGMSRPDRPHTRRLKATGQEISLTIETPTAPAGQTPVYLSINCLDCPREDDWLDRFKDQAEVNLSVTPGVSAQSLIRNTLIGGDCFDVSNITFTGNVNSRGTFSNGQASINLAQGMVLATGTVAGLPGPNNAGNWSGGFGLNSPDDPDLAKLTSGNQYDVSTITFEFTPTAPVVNFDFVFGSDEYCEYAGSTFNDVFGFFISGPGFNGTQNIALLPNGAPVAINNVNHLQNQQQYVNNNNFLFGGCFGYGQAAPNFCQLDGWTKVLKATANVIPCETYTLKLAIADINDALYGSAVFLRANSFEAGEGAKVEVVNPHGLDYAPEACGAPELRFSRAGDASDPLWVYFDIGGTATPGDDYEAFPDSVFFPAGVKEVTLPIQIFDDGIAEGEETIVISLATSCSCEQQQVALLIRDKEKLSVALQNVSYCGLDDVALTPAVSGGLVPYAYAWDAGSNAPSLLIGVPAAGTYGVTVTDVCGDSESASAFVQAATPPSASLIDGGGVWCVGEGQTLALPVALTGQSPWVLTVNGPDGPCADTILNVPYALEVGKAGQYELLGILSLANECPGEATGSAFVAEGIADLILTGQNPTCKGLSNGAIAVEVIGGAEPYLFEVASNGQSVALTQLGAGDYLITVQDAQGCVATDSIALSEPPALTATVAANVKIDCVNREAVPDLEVEGGTPGYAYNWSNGVSGILNPVFNAAGSYGVTVTDQNGCTATAVFVLTADVAAPVAGIIPPSGLTCAQPEAQLDGSISSSGGVYSYLWSGPGILGPNNVPIISVNAPGAYALEVRNTLNGCTASAEAIVAQDIASPDAQVSSPGNLNAAQPVLALSGAGSSSGSEYVYIWSSADGNFVCCENTLTPQIDQPGTYTLTVLNTLNGCTATASVVVLQDAAEPCDTKTFGCVTFELLAIFINPKNERTYRMRVTNNCAEPMIHTLFQLPNGVTARAPLTNTVYTAPSGRTYEVRNPNFSPYRSIRFKSLSDSIRSGASDIFEYALPPQAIPAYIQATARLKPATFHSAYLNTFFCDPIPTAFSGDGAEALAGDAGAGSPRETTGGAGSAVRVWPNPAGDHCYIEAPAGQDVLLRISDMQGRMLQERRLPSGGQVERLPLRGVVPDTGCYIFSFLREGHAPEHIRLMIGY